ncbi:MAG: serine hydrolase [Pseudomonadota bacterium]|nr:serine hydrolase [Pseudomonadota bacterium]
MVRWCGKLLGAVVGAAVFAASAAGQAPPPSAVRPTHTNAPTGFDGFIEAAMRAWRVPGVAISVVEDGRVVLARGYGVRQLGSAAPMTADTLFPIQSETKAFTALSAALLVDEGRFSLDAPISTYIPGFRMHDPVATLEVTSRDFLTHRSGLPSHGWLWLTNDRLTRGEAMERLPHLPSMDRFRSSWRYANLGYVAVAHAVENVAGTPWEQFVEARIFEPLGMSRTTFSRERALADPNHAGGSMWRGGRDVATPMQGTTPLTNSTGGIYSTANDMARWMIFQLGDGSHDGRRIVSSGLLAEMHRPQVVTHRPVPPPEFTSSAYGLGWFIESYRGETLVEHGGGHWGVNSVLALLPARRLGISIYANQHSDFSAYLMLAIVDRFIGPGSRDWMREMNAEKQAAEAEQLERERNPNRGRIADAPPSRALADFAGEYVHPGYGTVTIEVDRGELVAQSNSDRSRLRHWHYDTFVPTATEFGNIWAMVDDTKLQFLVDFDGRVSGLRLSSTVAGAVFERQRTEPSAASVR